MFPRVTHPSATLVLLRAFDLHVLSLPPAFALSQDQTLKLDEILNRLVTTFGEVPALIACETCVPQTVNGVDLKRVPPKSRPAASF